MVGEGIRDCLVVRADMVQGSFVTCKAPAAIVLSRNVCLEL